MKRIRISSSIANFHDRLRARYEDYGDFKWFSKDPTIFFGMYHLGDYLRLICHRGPAAVFWCGSDILGNHYLLFWLLSLLKVKHVCENTVEQRHLLHFYGVKADIHPMLFDDPEKYQITYEHSEKPRVWVTVHADRKAEYGLARLEGMAHEAPDVEFFVYGASRPFHEVWCGVDGFANTFGIPDGTIHNYQYANQPNITYCGKVEREQFLEETAKMQSTVRFNEFDGFSENLALAMLRGQYAFSVIPYPDIETISDDDTLIRQLKELKDKKQPHDTSYWREQLSKRVEI